MGLASLLAAFASIAFVQVELEAPDGATEEEKETLDAVAWVRDPSPGPNLPPHLQRRAPRVVVARRGTGDAVEPGPVILTRAPRPVVGRVVDWKGVPVAGAKLRWDPPPRERVRSAVGSLDPDDLTTITDENGWFLFVDVPEHVRELEVFPRDHPVLLLGPRWIEESLDRPVSHEIRLERWAEATVTAQAPDGRPAEGVEVILQRQASYDEVPWPWGPHNRMSFYDAATEASGAVTFDRLHPGRYSVQVRGWLPPAAVGTGTPTAPEHLTFVGPREVSPGNLDDHPLAYLWPMEDPLTCDFGPGPGSCTATVRPPLRHEFRVEGLPADRVDGLSVSVEPAVEGWRGTGLRFSSIRAIRDPDDPTRFVADLHPGMWTASVSSRHIDWLYATPLAPFDAAGTTHHVFDVASILMPTKSGR